MDGVFLFEGFRLDRQARTLFWRDEAGVFVRTAIGSRALDVLGVLVGRAPRLASRDELMAAVWPAKVVEDTNLNMQIAVLRRLLDGGRAGGKLHPDHPPPRLPLYRPSDAGRGRPAVERRGRVPLAPACGRSPGSNEPRSAA